jgi:hypothetical protein
MQARRRRVGTLIGGFGLPRWLTAARALRVGGAPRQWPPPTLEPRVRRPVYRVWWAWAVLGSFVVLVASLTFVVSSESTPVAAQVTRTHTGASGGGSSSGTSPGSAATGSGIGFARGVPLGVYAGEANLFGVAGFGLQTGTLPSLATDYLAKSGGWAVWETASNIKAWSPTRYHLVIGVPILPGVGTLAQGATGAYNQYFKTLGENLVAYHESDAILRLGWEFNGNWFRWSVATSADAANFVAFWRQIVTTMRGVAGAKFKFCWNPNGPSPTTYSPSQAYPGDAYVDYVGTDVYDNYWGTPFTSAASWVHQLTQQWGLDWLGAFAAEHNKPVAIPEWSDEYRTDGHGLGDDPNFIDEMAYWFVNNQVAFANVFSFDSSSTYRNNLLDGTFPKALAEFKADFG